MPEALLLIIDDDRPSRQLLQQLLRKDDYQLEFAEDGEMGLEMASRLQPDLILLDVVMPGMDGFEVCRRLRQDPKLAEVPILMLTALEDHESRLTGLEAGADDFISKPYHVAELRARVRTVVRLNRYRRIRTERDRFGWVVENVEHGYLVVDNQGHLLYANSKARGIFGLDDATQGHDMLPLLEGQFKLQPEEAWRNWPQLPQNEPLMLLRPETTQAPTSWLDVKVLSHSQEILLQLRDVTSELTSQRSVWSFESLICHKLRTPMTKITWGLSFIANKAERLSVPKIKEFAAQSQAGVDQLKGELESVLSYLNTPSARPSDGGFPVSYLEESLSEIVTQLELARVQVEYGPVIPASLPISRRAFEIILWELLQNSKKFHPEQNPLVVVRVSEQGDDTVLEVIDNGICLSPEQLDKAFLPYYQGERAFTGQIPGMGLGLTMVRQMLWEAGGECQIRNRQEGQGVILELRF